MPNVLVTCGNLTNVYTIFYHIHMTLTSVDMW